MCYTKSGAAGCFYSSKSAASFATAKTRRSQFVVTKIILLLQNCLDPNFQFALTLQKRDIVLAQLVFPAAEGHFAAA